MTFYKGTMTRRRSSLGASSVLGAIRGDIDPATGQVYDGAVWVTPNDGESENLSTAYKSYMNDPFVGMTEADKALYWAGQGGGGSSAFFAPAGTTGATFDAAAAAATQANADAYIAANADRLAALTATVRAAEATNLAERNYAVDYVAQAAGDLDKWYQLINPGVPRYEQASNGGAWLDNALLQYNALKDQVNLSSLAPAAAAAGAAGEQAYQDSLSHGGFQAQPGIQPAPAAGVITGALEAIDAAGGDSSQPTGIIDQKTGAVIAIASRNADGTVNVQVPSGSSSRSLSGVVNSVTGFIDRAAGTISDLGVQVQKVGNAIKGGAAGASAGYNLGDPKTLAIGSAVILALFLLPRRGRRN